MKLQIDLNKPRFQQKFCMLKIVKFILFVYEPAFVFFQVFVTEPNIILVFYPTFKKKHFSHI